jgi:uncharacterized repeat protein (TIGR03803 family)
MKTILLRFFVTFTSLVVLGQGAFAEVTFTVTPSAISNTDAGNITLQISGLTNGESVRIEKYLDANVNGTVDADDLLVLGFRLADGQARVIGGVTNLSFPGDLDGTGTNGAITSVWSFPASGIAQRMVGQYVFRLISPTDRFPATNVLFNVTNSPYAQSISGNVLAGASPVPNAGILLFPGFGMQGAPAAGVMADNAGHYSLKVASGAYTMWAFKSNYLADVSTAAVITLGAGASLSTNLYLLQATQAISGRCIYAGTNVSLPGLLTVCQSTNALLAIGFADTNGSFNIPVNAGQWEISTDDAALAAYFSYAFRNSPGVDTTTGSVANVSVTFRRGQAMFYGTVKDDRNQPLVGLDGYAEDDGNLYEGAGTTDQDGNYFIGVGAGNWRIAASQDDPDFSNYVFPQQGGYIGITNGQAIQLNVLALVATNHITGNVQVNGTNIVGVGVFADATIDGTNYQTGTSDTDANGNYTLNVANGTWNVGVRCSDGDRDSLDSILGSGNYQCPDSQTAVITNHNATNNFTVASGPLQVTTANLLNGTNGLFYNQQLAAVGGQPPYSWSLSPGSGSLPPDLSLAGNGVLSGIPVATGTSNFSARVTDSASNTMDQSLSLTIVVVPLQIATVSLPNAASGVFYNQQLAAFGGQPPYSWSLWSGSLTPGLSLATNGVISGTTTNLAYFFFTVRVSDFASSSMNQDLALTVVASTNLPLTTLYSFGGSDGSNPNGLVQGTDGNFYGTTYRGGAYTNYGDGLGTVFKTTPSGALTTLYSFGDIDGDGPVDGLVQGADGDFYGTTEYGGLYVSHWGDTFGTVFRITTNGTLTSLYSFSGGDGANPAAGLARGADGNFYGTTSAGGENYYLDDGTVFKIATDGSFTSLISLSGRNGNEPRGRLVQGLDGNFYGTTCAGGRYSWSRGTIFKMTTNGTLSTLYSFTGGSDGDYPVAGLVQGADGNFYGTTRYGGTNGSGTVFKIMTNGTFTSLYLFSGGADGANPAAGLVRGADGNFYGTTESGGIYQGRWGETFGTAFEITPDGVLTTVYFFTGGNDGAYPNSTLVQGADGNFYGTTYSGGVYGNGVIYRLSLGSVPAPVFQSVTKIGGMIALTWSSVAGQTYQLQYKTDLDQLSWTDSGSPTVATVATVTAYDSPGPDPHRFYRVKVSP